MTAADQIDRAAANIVLERTFEATLDDVWAMWTTPEGIESWWGPDGFSVRVRSLDLKVGGKLHYVMSATGAEQIAFMEDAGMPVSTDLVVTYTDVQSLKRLGYMNLADFIPGHEPYEVATVVELFPTEAGVRLVMTLDRMHDDVWTGRMVDGWESELTKLAVRLRKRAAD